MDWQVLTGSRLADAAAAGLIVLAAGSLAAWLCRQPVRRVRLIVLSLLGAMAVPALGALPIAPRWSVGLPAAPAVILTPADPATPAEAGSRPDSLRAAGSRVALGPREQPEEMPTGHARTGRALASSGPVAPAPAARWHFPSARAVLLGSYFAVAAGLAIWWLVGQLLIWRVTRSARPVPEAIRADFLGLAGPGSGRVMLLASDQITSPFTYTWRRPVILLPATLCDGSEPAALRYVLAHEWSHVESRDALAWNLACLAGLVLFYQPLFWWLRRQLRLCQDYLADARAAAAGSAEDYATFLVRLARVRGSAPAVPALGIGDRRSNLYRRVIMLMQDHEPLERRCRAVWSLSAAMAAAVVIVFASGLRLGAAPPAADGPVKGTQTVKDADRPTPDAKTAVETLHYKGTVVDKDTGKPIAGATVVVRRSILRSTENRVLQETRHTTGTDGAYSFTIPPDQHASPYLYIELDVEHPDYATRAGFGYALSMIRKNEKLNERPFFELIEMRAAQPITGRVETPEGEPAAGVDLLAYSRTDKGAKDHFEYGSFARAKTDRQGQFRLPITTPGRGVYWVLPKNYAPELHLVPDGKRGDLGTTTLKKGAAVTGRVLDVQGKPLAGVFIEVRRERGSGPEFEALGQMMVADSIRRAAETDAEGRFTLDPLPPGEFRVMPTDVNYTSDRSAGWTRKELPGVFASTKLTIKEGEHPAPLEVRASPAVVIEGHWVDSKGQPKGGWGSHVFGQIDGSFWFAEARPDAQGRFSLKVPHGLEKVQLDISTNEHASTRHRIGKDGPLVEGRRVELGTLDHDVKDIEIIRFVAPIIVINATTKDGKQIKDFKSTVQYTASGPDAYDLRLISSVKDVSAIPTAGKRLVIVAAVDRVLHFRIFDNDGKRVVDKDATQRTAQTKQLEDLKKQLENLWPPHELTKSEKGRVIDAVTSIVGYTRPDRERNVHVVGGGKRKDAIQDEQYDGRYRTSQMLPDKEVTVAVSADGFEAASRTLSLAEGKTEEVTFVLEPKAPQGASR